MGYRQSLSEAEIEINECLVRNTGGYFGDDAEAENATIDIATSLVEGKLDFTAVFASTDTLAYKVIKAFRRFNIRVPERVSLIGLDDCRRI